MPEPSYNFAGARLSNAELTARLVAGKAALLNEKGARRSRAAVFAGGQRLTQAIYLADVPELWPRTGPTAAIATCTCNCHLRKASLAVAEASARRAIEVMNFRVLNRALLRDVLLARPARRA